MSIFYAAQMLKVLIFYTFQLFGTNTLLNFGWLLNVLHNFMTMIYIYFMYGVEAFYHYVMYNDGEEN